MTRLLTLVVLGLALVSTLAEAKSKRIHVTAEVKQATLIGDPDNPKIGDERITSVALVADNSTEVGTGVGVCTLATPPGVDALQQCLLTAAFDEGHIIFGGIAPLPAPGSIARFGILGGTGEFREARGEATLIITSTGDIDSTFDLDLPLLP
jgi:hypothetical protein